MSIKIALLFSGHLRSFEKTYISFLENFSHLNDIDIFCHTWNTLGHNDKVWWNNNGDSIYNKKLNEVHLQNLRNFYNPKKIKIDNSINFVSENDEYNNKYVGYNALKNQWEGLYRVNQLRLDYENETNKKYDCVIRSRYDIKYQETFFNEHLIKKCLDKYKFNFLYSYTDKKEDLYSDSFYFSCPYYFDNLINNMYDKVDKFIYASINKFKVIEGEATITEFLRKNFENENDYNRFRYKCSILRLDGRELPLYFD
jgi:hypothetical protein